MDGCQDRSKREMQRWYHVDMYSFCLTFWEIGSHQRNSLLVFVRCSARVGMERGLVHRLYRPITLSTRVHFFLVQIDADGPDLALDLDPDSTFDSDEISSG
ncbi:hypothetical protein EVAR_78794_1 [Eumeta japonica]|uniref:Uncharacterized protein n=1 Tax=Eumeta variegata TaxID=151549 RepID=A0A4C1T1H8_EUMVA|nr:hypothetical protein EVAR_78794_1 [Eumeta japonica]